MKKILSLLLVLMICFSTSACSIKFWVREKPQSQTESVNETQSTTAEETTVAVQDNKKPSPLLYKVTDDKGNYIWLFGSIHVGKDEFYPLPDYVTKAFDNSDSLAVEFDIVAFEQDVSAQMQAITPFVYSDGTTIKDHISTDTYNKAVEILKENNSYSEMLDLYMPSMWSSSIDNFIYTKNGADTEKGIDLHFINEAYEQKKEVLSVESAALQYSMMAGFSEELQEFMLEETVESYYDEDAKEEINELMDVWLSGNEKEIVDMLNEDADYDDVKEKKLYEEYNNAVVVTRNLAMTDYAEDALTSGEKVFICVGTAHVVGDGGMADQLEERGYKVEVIKS